MATRAVLARAPKRRGLDTLIRRSSAVVPDITEHDLVKPFEALPTPSGPRSWPLIGPLFNFKPFTEFTPLTVNRMLDKMHNEFGDTFRFKMGQWYVCTADPEAMDTIIRHEEKFPLRPSLDLYETYVRREGRPGNLGVLNGPEWWELRKKIQKKLLPPRSAAMYLDAQNAVTDEFINLIKNKPMTPEELRDTYFRFAVEAISVVVFNKRMGFLANDTIPPECEEYIQAVKDFFAVFNTFIGKAPFWRYFRTPLYMKMKTAADKAYDFAEAAAAEALEKGLELERTGQWDPNEPNFLMSVFASEKHSISQIGSLLQDLMIGGTDSTAKNIEFFLYSLASNPDAQEKLYSEIVETVGPKEAVSEKALSHMPYLKACQKESFRMRYPVPIGTVRILQNSLNMNGYYVPEGTIVIMNNPRLVKDPKYVQDPDQFRPERWVRNANGQLNNGIPSIALLPFSFGPRKCIGQRFAEQEANLVIIKTLQNFKISLPENFEEPDIVYEVFGTFSKPIPFVFTPRDEA